MNAEIKKLFGVGAAVAAVVAFGVVLAMMSGGGERAVVSGDTLVRADSYRIASASATVTMVEFADFQCEACRAAYLGVKRLLEEHKNDVAFVLRYFPLPGHTHSRIAAEAAEAAGAQGKFWEMGELLFRYQDQWGRDVAPVSDAQARAFFVGYAKELGLDVDRFTRELDGRVYADKVARDFADAQALRLDGTPSFFIDGKKVERAPSYENLKREIEAARTGIR